MALLLVLAFVLRLLLIGLRRHIAFYELQMLQHGLRQLLKGALIVDGEAQRIEIGARLLLDPFIDHRHASDGILGDRLAGQSLAHLQRQRSRKRHFIGGSRPAQRV